MVTKFEIIGLLGMQRETELNMKLFDFSQTDEFIRRVKSINVPYDVGRLPNNIFDKGEGLNGITAVNGNYILRCMLCHVSSNFCHQKHISVCFY